jgi:N-acetylneuraminate lyase
MISPAAFPEEADLYRVCELPNVIGVKFTDYNLYLLQRLTDRGLLVYNGRDEVLGAGLLMGASGGIGSTFSLVPREAIGIARAARAGDWPAVQRFQRSLNAVLNVLLQFPYLAAVKAACTMSYGLDFGSVLGEGFETPAQEDELLRQLASAIPSSGSDNKTTSFLSLR